MLGLRYTGGCAVESTASGKIAPLSGRLASAKDPHAEQRRITEVIGHSGEALLAFVNDILDFSKMEAGKLELECIVFDPNALIDDIAASRSPRIFDKGLEFVKLVSPDLPSMVRGDPRRSRQILLNLLSNATKFTSQGCIVLKAETEDESDGDATIRFRVQDTGIGIAPEKQEMLFQKFTQVDASTTRQFGARSRVWRSPDSWWR